MMEQALQQAINTIVKTADPDKIILFGSRARGDNRLDSDYDLLVLKKGIEKPREVGRKLYRSLVPVGLAVDLIVETPERFNELKENKFLIYREIAKGKVIYEK